ncbi:ureidoglycolate lyase [Acidisoma cellulosilytica]|uniref:Ureidoglycolate lyase n=1 Tax=Acidisoma cellulosilyticum TaxID=2802395 RepID=A0A964E4L4_9PROT|nr:ureidoglycolate lyase [Acidisoma cellulosilyticum]MCB8881596.1 ureidoglycolate lyase [Acidisoma cellulosilyticum]
MRQAMAQAIPEPVHMPNYSSIDVRILIAEPITAANFAPFGKLVEPTADGTPAGEIDHALDLSGGRPRFYIMALTHRPLTVSGITRHAQATQVLAAVGGLPWLLAVAPGNAASNAPDPAAIRAFTVPGHVAVLLDRGTWHAGPYFSTAEMSFFNLELEDTNIVDHDTCDLAAQFGLTFDLRPAA